MKGYLVFYEDMDGVEDYSMVFADNSDDAIAIIEERYGSSVDIKYVV